MTADRLLQVADLAAAGWTPDALVARIQTGEGAVPTGVCQQQSLLAYAGVGTRVRVDLRWTAAHGVAATFASTAQAGAAYDALAAGLAACRTGAWSPPGVRRAVGPGVRVDVPGGQGRGVWSTVVPAAGTGTGTTGETTSASTASTFATVRPGVMGVLLVGRRVAVVQVDDAEPRSSTVGAIMSSAARRLAG